MKSPYIRVTIVWGAMLLIWAGLLSLSYWMYGDRYTLEGHIWLALLASILAVPMLLIARRKLDGGTLAGLGLPFVLKAAVKPFVIGAISFLVPFTLGLAIVLGFGWTTITAVAGMAEILAFLPLLVVLVFLYEALPEELAFRGYIYQALAERHSRILSVIAQALLFGVWGTILWAIRLEAVPLDRFMLFISIGFVLGLVRVITGSVWASIGLHTAFQTIAQLLLNEERGHFAVTGTDTLQLIALGIVPFALAAMIAERASVREVAWLKTEGRD